jgi:magnesium chelatase family protein
MNVHIVDLETAYTRGFSGSQLIGNVSEICRDGKERVTTALESLGVKIPNKRLIISLTPAELRKEGSHLDLPMAVSMSLLCSEQVAVVDVDGWLFAAEIGLLGDLKPVRGIVSFAVKAVRCGLKGLVVARGNLRELDALARCDSELMGSLPILTFDHLGEVLNWVFQGEEPRRIHFDKASPTEVAAAKNFDDMILTRDQELAAMACAAGCHNIVLHGTPGTGKSMFAERLTSIFPRMERREHLEAMQIHSLYANTMNKELLAGIPPFRSPHHSASTAALLGGMEEPGELSLAHGGILFLDEMIEFKRDFLEALRVPLESGEVWISRAKSKVKWHCRILMVGATNNCPCGWSGSKSRRCFCSNKVIQQYHNKISGPILDRTDIKLAFDRVQYSMEDFFGQISLSSDRTARMSNQVKAAREQAERRNLQWSVTFNRDLPSKDLLTACRLEEKAFLKILRKYTRSTPSQRSVIRALRVARTLADLDDRDAVQEADLATAFGWQSYSPLTASPMLRSTFAPEESSRL